MSLMEHLEELRKRIVHSAIYLAIGFFIAYVFHERLYGFVQAPLDKLGIKLNYTHPMDPLNLYLQVSFIGGAILASPFVLYQGLWLFIAPGLYQKEKRFVIPFHDGLYRRASFLPARASVDTSSFSPEHSRPSSSASAASSNPIVTIEEYTGFLLSIILGLCVSFELPILIFFLAMFGIVSSRKFLWKNIRYGDPRCIPGCRNHLSAAPTREPCASMRDSDAGSLLSHRASRRRCWWCPPRAQKEN